MNIADSSLLPFQDDFKHLLEIRNFLYTVVQELKDNSSWSSELQSGIFKKLPNGRQIRIVLPRGRDETYRLLQESPTDSTDTLESDKNLQELTFVGFVGYIKPREAMTSDVIERMWTADNRLIAEFQNQKYLMAYVSAEREIGGNWMNLVLCSNPQGISDWHNFEFHTNLARDVSPDYYSHIRIHRGSLENGLKSEKFTVKQTLFLAYGNSKCERSDVKRHCQIWNKLEVGEYFITDSS